MPVYYTQQFKYQNGDTIFYGVQGEHNHDKANMFTVHAKEWLVTNAHWPLSMIVQGNFKSNQPKPAQGKELAWNNALRRWEKV